MPENFSTLALILKKEPFRERDSKVTLFGLEQGLMTIVARGTVEPLSRMAGHLEPYSLASVRVVGGRRQLYAAGAQQEIAFAGLKADYDRLAAAGAAARLLLRFVKPGLPDPDLHRLLLGLLSALDRADPAKAGFLKDLFALKLMTLLGLAPELRTCANDGAKLKAETNYWSPAKGGVLCPACGRGQDALTISPDCLKIMRLAMAKDLDSFLKIMINKNLVKETAVLVDGHIQYNLN